MTDPHTIAHHTPIVVVPCAAQSGGAKRAKANLRGSSSIPAFWRVRRAQIRLCLDKTDVVAAKDSILVEFLVAQQCGCFCDIESLCTKLLALLLHYTLKRATHNW
jgi:hypothetical protein